MTWLTRPLVEEHRELLPGIDRILEVADLVGAASLGVLRRRVGEVCDFVYEVFIPYAIDEDRNLYPVVDRIAGTHEATASMRREQLQIARLAGDLQELREHLQDPVMTGVQKRSLRRVLYGLHALLRLHLEVEEDVFLPLLEARLSPSEAHDLVVDMEERWRPHDGGLEVTAG
jgi:hemerythrin-like domain-containing protein